MWHSVFRTCPPTRRAPLPALASWKHSCENRVEV
jgi:hypothetical protein